MIKIEQTLISMEVAEMVGNIVNYSEIFTDMRNNLPKLKLALPISLRKLQIPLDFLSSKYYYEFVELNK